MNRGWKVVAAILVWLLLMWVLLVGVTQEENQGSEIFNEWLTTLPQQ